MSAPRETSSGRCRQGLLLGSSGSGGAGPLGAGLEQQLAAQQQQLAAAEAESHRRKVVLAGTGGEEPQVLTLEAHCGSPRGR